MQEGPSEILKKLIELSEAIPNKGKELVEAANFGNHDKLRELLREFKYFNELEKSQELADEQAFDDLLNTARLKGVRASIPEKEYKKASTHFTGCIHGALRMAARAGDSVSVQIILQDSPYGPYVPYIADALCDAITSGHSALVVNVMEIASRRIYTKQFEIIMKCAQDNRSEDLVEYLSDVRKFLPLKDNDNNLRSHKKPLSFAYQNQQKQNQSKFDDSNSSDEPNSSCRLS